MAAVCAAAAVPTIAMARALSASGALPIRTAPSMPSATAATATWCQWVGISPFSSVRSSGWMLTPPPVSRIPCARLR